MYVARVDSSGILNTECVYASWVFRPESFFYIKNIESLILSQILSDSIVMAEELAE